VAPGDAIAAVVSYTASGREALFYDVAGSGRSGLVEVDLELHDAPRAVVPPDSLQPAARDGSHLRWRFESLITDKAIVVELPAGSSPLGRVILLLQLAGLAVLLFGGGFWYLSEGDEPGRLDDFRWGHFLLLALNYSLFFGIFAVLGYRGSAPLSLAVASAVSLPLLMLHVARIATPRFAFRSALPLAVLSLGTVVAGVFLEEQRALVFLGASIALIAFATLSFRGWAAGREAYEETKKERRLREERRKTLEQDGEKLSEKLQALALMRTTALRALEDTPRGFEAERAEVERNLERLGASLEDARRLTALETDWPDLSLEEYMARFRDQMTAVEKECSLLDRRGKALRKSVGALENGIQQALTGLREQLGDLEHALGAGSALSVEARSLLEEGGEQLERERGEVEEDLGRLARASERAQHFREQETREKADGDIRSRASSADRHARLVTAHVERLGDSSQRLRLAQRKIAEYRRAERSGEASVHCLACGRDLAPSNHFCAHCGTARPLDVECGACGATTQLPSHLLRRSWAELALYCPACGSKMPPPGDEPAAGE
jgi:hypothetical protein